MQFLKYALVGVINTCIHWVSFFSLYLYFPSSQAICNFSAFVVAVTISFILNSRWTFKRKATKVRYILFTGFMGLVAVGVGAVSDAAKLNPVITVMVFSATSLFIGFIYSKFFVFK